MRPIGRVFALGVGIACATRTFGEEDALPLTAPSTGPPPAASAGALPPVLEPPLTGDSRSRPAAPGLAAPRTGVADPGLPPFEPAGPSIVGDLPGPTDPVELPQPRPAPERVIRPVPREPGRSSTIESVPGGTPAGTGSRSPSLRGPMSAPRRPLGFLGRLLPPPPYNRGPAPARDSITVEPGDDPASDAALKRRIEHQVRQTYGDRLQAVDVRVVGREVTIHARASRFWQRRALRRSLESLPSLSGLRSSIEVE